jgi:hypothetical protein
LEQQQAAAPMQAGPQGGIDPRVMDAASGPSMADHPDAFAPTERPGEPITSGIDMGAGVGDSALDPADPMMVLQAAYALFPHPEIARAMMSDGNLR